MNHSRVHLNQVEWFGFVAIDLILLFTHTYRILLAHVCSIVLHLFLSWLSDTFPRVTVFFSYFLFIFSIRFAYSFHLIFEKKNLVSMHRLLLFSSYSLQNLFLFSCHCQKKPLALSCCCNTVFNWMVLSYSCICDYWECILYISPKNRCDIYWVTLIQFHRLFILKIAQAIDCSHWKFASAIKWLSLARISISEFEYSRIL